MDRGIIYLQRSFQHLELMNSQTKVVKQRRKTTQGIVHCQVRRMVLLKVFFQIIAMNL